MNAPFPNNPRLLAFVLAWNNKDLIADQVLPRVDVGGDTYKYTSYPMAEMFSPPEDYVGRTGRVNEVQFSGTEATGAVSDHGLDSVIPLSDIQKAKDSGGTYDPEARAVIGITSYIALNREKRVANLVMNPAIYPASNKETLTSGGYLDDPTVNAYTVLKDALATPFVRPNQIVMSRKVFDAVAANPFIVAAAVGTSAAGKALTREMLAALLEVNQILVGEAYVNTAKPGQAPSLGRAWNNGIAMQYIDRNAGPEGTLTFGWTGQWGGKVAWRKVETEQGLRGAVRVRSGESVGETIVSSAAGYFIENAINPSNFS